ncbi:hypothetical protein N7522_013850 [Penicillium canescens]|uniref:uncharacterized protein n=1 Tax=Penicillium canescens TaxID=5083 RepID=UPI0026DFF475|nr:uncharacterized protein N7446_009106 [Penicillium canescens]KAJ5981429.1 hypothetical protein N7522_013850 [Penicillium canescens]KAJ6053094.1 hypothetical protein N7446_009106 [Penicillium canescens]
MIQSLYTLLCILLSQIDNMSFHESATHIELEDGHILKAVLRNGEGDEQESILDLNSIIGNNDGLSQLLTTHFRTILLGGENFHESASDISFEREGDPEIPVLRAVLGNVEGEGQDADINLAERITNINGELVFE